MRRECLGPQRSQSSVSYDPLLNPNSLTILDDRAMVAARMHRPAHILSPRDEVQVDVGPPASGRGFVECLLRLLGIARTHPAQPIRDAMDVRIHAYIEFALEPDNQHKI